MAGLALLGAELFSSKSVSPAAYFCYLAMAFGTSRIAIPGRGNTARPVFLVFVFLGILDWDLPATLFLACTATALQSLREASEHGGAVPKAWRALWNVFSRATATAVSYSAYHSLARSGTLIEIPVRLAAAAILFFVVDAFLPLQFRKERYLRPLPDYLAYAGIAGLVSIVGRMVGWQTGLLVPSLLYVAYRYYSQHLGRVEHDKKKAEEMAALHLRTIHALALAIEAKDHTTHDHLRRILVFAAGVGEEMGLSKADREALLAAAMLHDIGQLAVPEHIIAKPGKLTREEFDKLKIHPVVGAEILERVRFPYPVAPMVRSHHEKWNGSGYPDGLCGEEIPAGARILAAVDALDALASDRHYRRALPIGEAMRCVAAEAGASFDPRVVEILERRCVELEKIVQSQWPEPARLAAHPQIGKAAESGPGPKQAEFEDAVHSQAEPGDFLEQIAAARQEVQDLFELAKDIGTSLSLNETLSLLAIRLKRIVPHDALAIYVPHEKILKPEYVTGENFQLFSTLEVPVGQGLSGWVAENRKPILNGNPAAEPGYLNDETKFTSMRSALAVPLIGLSEVVSVLTLYHRDVDAFSRDHLRILLAIAAKVGHSIENARKYEQAESCAATDYMTGLPNARSLFQQLDSELARSRRQSSPVVVLVCDLNGFKGVNDRFGHVEGNRLLRVVAGKLKDCCREYDYVARMGGDEFVIMLPAIRLDQTKSTLQRLNNATQAAGQEVCGIDTLSLSIGAAMYPDDGTEAEQLLSEADRRMYLAKQKYKARLADPRGFDFDHVVAV